MLIFALRRRFYLPLFAFAAGAFFAGPALAGDVVYQNDFEKVDIGKTPDDFTIASGVFTVQQEGGNKFLELPGAPLDNFGLLFGPPVKGNAAASVRVYGTKTGRKEPAFGISLNGVSGYRFQVSPLKKALEIYKGDESKVNVPYAWASGTWTKLRLEVHKVGDKWVAQGKAWPEGQPEPADWQIKFEDPEPSAPGRAGIWASPFSGTPIRFDDLRLENLP
ncbi:MAG TPA: hypothetical protein VGH90_11500 [Chthoniobacteraceae bacterium]|jgi:hypothetical protein